MSTRCQDRKILEYSLIIDHKRIISTILTMTICRSSKATDVDKEIYGSKVAVLTGEKLTVRILVSSMSSVTTYHLLDSITDQLHKLDIFSLNDCRNMQR